MSEEKSGQQIVFEAASPDQAKVDLATCIEVIKRYRATRDWHHAESNRQQTKMHEQGALVIDAINDLRERFLKLYPEGNVEQFFLEAGIA